MPQFDIFSFLTQLFWVFLLFSLFYLCLSFYALPAFATTLKIRRRKQAPILNSAAVSVDIVSTNFDGFEIFAKTSVEKSQKDSALSAHAAVTESTQDFLFSNYFAVWLQLFSNDVKIFGSSICIAQK